MKTAIASTIAAAILSISIGAAHADNAPKPTDIATQNAVADYNAGNLVAARSEFAARRNGAAGSRNSITR